MDLIARGRGEPPIPGWRPRQRHTSQFLAGKTFAESGSFGPWLVTTNGIPDPT